MSAKDISTIEGIGKKTAETIVKGLHKIIKWGLSKWC
jgi:Holliday junction resolvasome RuvABC DNA-binding subunit